MISTEQYAAADRDLPTEAELSVEEAIQIVLSHDQEEEQTDSAPATQAVSPPEPATPVASIRKILDSLHDVQDLCMSRNDFGDITETLQFLILNAEQKQQHSRTRTTQTSIVNYFSH